ncbi:hypothetical protein K7W42_17645 [Deinococcus sp. HMF7604]|uniref:hypothetical protein n=1 Tax=Deinococcus betulae TaxID=2873312 RepID=UPI001CCFF294|nr:hypothetical protein [Deinococcus betulae]MBZ9752669.1 hypothetical protein [Deinococcus betulae]
MGLAADVDVQGPVTRIETLEGHQVTGVTQISTDGRSAVFTSPRDKTLRGEYRYDPRTNRLSYTQHSQEGLLTFFSEYSPGGCLTRSEVKPPKDSGFPATTTATHCDAENRAVRTEERIAGVRDPVVITRAWTLGGRLAREVSVDYRGRETREERYDASGRLISSKVVDAYGTHLTIAVTHKDDAYGNWLMRRTVTEVRFACAPGPTATQYGLKCQPNLQPQVQLEQRRLTYR